MPGGGAMTLHVSGTCREDFSRVTLFRCEIFKYTPCLGVWLSSGDFFGGESIVMQISFVMLIFYCLLLFSNQLFLGEEQIPGANCLREKPAVSQTMYQNTEELFSKETQQVLVLYVIL